MAKRDGAYALMTGNQSGAVLLNYILDYAVETGTLPKTSATSEMEYGEYFEELLKETGIVKNERDGIKILGNGELTKNITVKAAVFSATAKEKIEAAGGKIEEV